MIKTNHSLVLIASAPGNAGEKRVADNRNERINIMHAKRTILGLIATGVLATVWTTTGNQRAQGSSEGKRPIAILKGSWGYSFGGQVLDGPFAGPYVTAGRLEFDEQGNFSGVDTINSNGQVVSRTYVGTSTVNPDGTGSLALVDSFANSIHLNFVLVHGAREMKFVQTDPGVLTEGSLQRQ